MTTTTKRPNIANLRARAKAQGLVITKADDASTSGYCEYVLHAPGADWENMEMVSLYGIKNMIEKMEADEAASIEADAKAQAATVEPTHYLITFNREAIGVVAIDVVDAWRIAGDMGISAQVARVDVAMSKAEWDARTVEPTTESLKGEDKFREAGALAYAQRKGRNYGCHYGMRSTRQAAIDAFNAGYDAAERERADAIAVMASEPDNGDRFY